MKTYKGDLHIHSVLSPCADLTMGPKDIINRAKQRGLDMISITDHNSAENLKAFDELTRNNNELTLIYGLEVETFEEVHLLCYFDNMQDVLRLNAKINESLENIPNDPQIFGEQVIVNSSEEISGF